MSERSAPIDTGYWRPRRGRGRRRYRISDEGIERQANARYPNHATICLLPVPHLSEEVLHVDLLVLHLHDPGVIQHAPRTCPACSILFQTVPTVSIRTDTKSGSDPTHQHAMKYFMFSLHLIPMAGSSRNSGIGCRTIYVRRSITFDLALAPLSSCCPNGNRCCATSRSVTPNDQTSDVMVYERP